jgi:ABC-type nickel/cobalt efflux system permease component RcnA
MTIRRKIRLAGVTGFIAAILAGLAGIAAWYIERAGVVLPGVVVEIGIPALQLAASILCLATAVLFLVVTVTSTRRRRREAHRAPAETTVPGIVPSAPLSVRPETPVLYDVGELGELEEIEELEEVAATPADTHKAALEASAFIAPDSDLEELEVVEASDDLEELEVIDPKDDGSAAKASEPSLRGDDPIV